ncbi:mechanosensitive ion channel domain-containing protein [Solimicrobium silvestre]|uniref:Mechanosensitive ion channel n=1 Tax=Solimicrobium silvestre TaxID=2099400 RepID=A0A2S9H4N1_9BURK|nr:mechanosensitive ion channel domain-containing protein [Solimicrobium silvestre]PRC94903.1 Mechanosensitive ion channel [Solimicrobium silvestre]
MSEIVRFFHEIDRSFLRDILMTLVLITALAIVRAMLRRAILQRDSLQPEIKRRWLGTTRNVLLGILMLGIIMIWGNEIESFAVSLVAVAAAFVLATREMLLCILGSVYRTSTDVCRIGDWVEINGIKGQIIDMNLFSTSLVESSRSCSDKNTVGRAITIPNSMFFSQPMYNETRLGNFVTQSVHIKLERDDNWELAEQILLDVGNKIISEYADKLAHNTHKMTHIYALEAPLQHAQVWLSLDDINHVALHLQLPAPLGKSARIEQRILREFLSKMPPTTNYRTYANKAN